MAKRSHTAESVIHIAIIVLNLNKYLREALCCRLQAYRNYRNALKPANYNHFIHQIIGQAA